jgi:hypothetical protein
MISRRFETMQESVGVGVFSWILTCIFTVQCLLVCITLAGTGLEPVRWSEEFFVLFGLTTTLIALSRHLPWQNVIWASIIIGSVAGTVHALGNMFFGSAKAAAGSAISWQLPVIWVMVILNARGVARLAMARWRAGAVYGLWLLSVTFFLVLLFAPGSQYLEQGLGFRRPAGTAQSIVWRENVPWIPLLLAGLSATIALLLVSSSLINKRPIERAPTAEPLVVWLSLNLVSVSAALSQRAFAAASITLLGNIGILGMVFSTRNRTSTIPPLGT